MQVDVAHNEQGCTEGKINQLYPASLTQNTHALADKTIYMLLTYKKYLFTVLDHLQSLNKGNIQTKKELPRQTGRRNSTQRPCSLLCY